MPQITLTWSQVFHMAQRVQDPRTCIGRYFVRSFDEHKSVRTFGFRLYNVLLINNGRWEDLGFDVVLCKWEMEQGYHHYSGVLRDLWSLPEHAREEPYARLTAGRLLWFLHCFELTHPTLFERPFEYGYREEVAPPRSHTLVSL